LDQAGQELPFAQNSGQETPTGDAGLPGWLTGAAGEFSAETPQASEAPSNPQAQEDLPSWLSGSDAEFSSQSSTPAEPLPSWLSGLVGDEPPAATPEEPAPEPQAADTAETGEALPDWLREQSGSRSAAADSGDSKAALWADAGPRAEPPVEPAAPAPSAGETDDTGVPGWLRDISDDEIRRVMEGDEGAEEGISVEPFSFGEPSTPSSGASNADIPAWLSGASEDTGSQRDSEPSWLASLPDEPEQPPTGDQSSGPAWLDSLSGELSTSEAASQPDVPLWLQDLDSEPASQVPAAAPGQSPAEQPATPSAPQPAEQLPAWLRETEQAPTPAEALPAWLQEEPTGTAPAEELPAWLNVETSSAAPQSEIPSWLSADIAAPPASSSGPPPAEDLPPWLSDAITSAPQPAPLPPLESKPIPPAPNTPPGTAEELPSWLRAETPAPAAEELPDWLQSSPQSAPQTGPALHAPDAGPAAALPDWLQASPPSQPPAPPPAPSAASPADDLPPWLRDDAGQPLPTAGAPGDANLPEWLRGESSAGPAAPSDAAPPAVPDWLNAETPPASAPSAPPNLDWFDESPGTGVAGRAPAGESEFFGGAELPAWLRKADAEPASEISPADARSLDWLTKLGAHEEESAVVAAAPSVKLPLPQAPARSDAQISALALLRRLAAEPYPDVAPAAATDEPSILQRIGLDRALYVLLLVALLAALAVPSLAAGLQSPPEDPSAAALFQRIDALTDKDTVLIGYEWDARRIGELKPLEQAVVGQLIQKRVKLILISTDPQGALLLFDLRDDLVRAGYRSDAQDYILLGYKPGGDLALRSLAQDFRGVLQSDFQGNDATVSALIGGFETGKPIGTLNDLAMTLVLADDAADVQGWAEQVYRVVPQKPLAFLLPAEAAPIVQPYLQPPRNPAQVQIGHLAGKQGALAYEHLRGSGQTPNVQVLREIGQQRLGVLVFVVLLLVGGVAVVASGALRRGAGA
jgi:hypothetical protein